MKNKIINIYTYPYKDQEFGTSGIRKSVKTFQQYHYLHNILSSIFHVCDFKNKSIIVGGDGRYFNKEAIMIALQMLIAFKVKKVVIGINGWFSTPAVSCYIRKYSLDYGIIFSASHNPAGKNGDFGIKVNNNKGFPIEESLCEKIYEYTKNISNYSIFKDFSIDIAKPQKTKIFETQIEVINSVNDYSALMESIFDFNKIYSLFKSGFSMMYEGYNAISGIYAKEIFFNKLNVPMNSLQNITPLEDFGNNHADPNSLYAKHLIDKSITSDSPDILFASDGDADRNMIIGKDALVTPSDSLAVILLYANLIPYYKENLGVARSMPTSSAVDRVAKHLNIPCYVVPTGWKYFGNLLEKKLITFCGEESYGTSSSHCGEKDGIWAMLFWLNILVETKSTVKDILNNLWKNFGRSYFMRLDYFNISSEIKNNIFDNLLKLNGINYANNIIKTNTFNYVSPLTGENYVNKGYIINVGNNSRIVIRSSGTDTNSLTLRVYLETFVNSDSNLINKNRFLVLDNLIKFINTYFFKNIKPNVID